MEKVESMVICMRYHSKVCGLYFFRNKYFYSARMHKIY